AAVIGEDRLAQGKSGDQAASRQQQDSTHRHPPFRGACRIGGGMKRASGPYSPSTLPGRKMSSIIAWFSPSMFCDWSSWIVRSAASRKYQLIVVKWQSSKRGSGPPP